MVRRACSLTLLTVVLAARDGAVAPSPDEIDRRSTAASAPVVMPRAIAPDRHVQRRTTAAVQLLVTHARVLEGRTRRVPIAGASPPRISLTASRSCATSAVLRVTFHASANG